MVWLKILIIWQTLIIKHEGGFVVMGHSKKGAGYLHEIVILIKLTISCIAIAVCVFC
jgi:hypothetical protein